VLALDDHGPIAGAASALMGTLHFVTGALVMALTGLFTDGTASAMLIGIASSSLIAFAMARGTLGGWKRSG
jgi:DHA1 family bicyclomycin/chloramphenicol resistance-like MFS transporter